MSSSLVSEQSVVTNIKFTKYKYTWTIKNFTTKSTPETKKISSPAFAISHDDSCHGSIEITWPAPGHDPVLHIAGKIVKGSLSNNGYSDVQIDCKMKGISGCCNYEFLKGGTAFFYSSRYSNSELYGYVRHELTISCKIYVYDDTINYQNLITNPTLSRNESNNEFAQLFNDQTFSDLTIEVGNRLFFAHKVILATRNRVFSTMLTINMKEKSEGKIVIGDIKPDVMEKVLRYIYTNKVSDVQPEMEGELLVAADMYDLQELKILCENRMMSRINLENAVEFFTLASRYQAKALGACALGFIKSHSKEIMESETFKKDLKFHSPLLAQLYLDSLSSTKGSI